MKRVLLMGALVASLVGVGAGTASAAPATEGVPVSATVQDYVLVTPRPGMDNVHPQSWDSVERINSRTLRVHFTSGVAPCSVLDHVTVSYSFWNVKITLHEGSDPSAAGRMCAMLAQHKAVDVKLEQPLWGRTVTDGTLEGEQLQG